MLQIIWFNLCKVINTEYENTEIDRSLVILEEIIEDCESHYLNNGKLKYFESNVNILNIVPVQGLIKLSLKYRLYKQSLFYWDFVKVSELTRSEVACGVSSSKSNQYYAPEFASYFEKHQAPFIASVAPFIHIIRGYTDVRRTSNAVVEGSFGATKTRIKENINLHEKTDQIASSPLKAREFMLKEP